MDPDLPSSTNPYSAEESARARFLASMGFGETASSDDEQDPSPGGGDASATDEAEPAATEGLALSSHEEWELPGYSPASGDAPQGSSSRFARCQIERVEFGPADLTREERFDAGIARDDEAAAEIESAAAATEVDADVSDEPRRIDADATAADPARFAEDEEDTLFQLECPKCHGELVLKREHLGVEGSCVWCGIDIVAAPFGPERRVRVFPLFKPSPAIPTSEGIPRSPSTSEVDPEPLAAEASEASEARPQDGIVSAWGLDLPAEEDATGGAPSLTSTMQFAPEDDEDLAPVAGSPSPAANSPEPEGFGGGFAQAGVDPAEAARDADARPSLVESAPAPAEAPPEAESFGGFAQAWNAPMESAPVAEAPPSLIESAPVPAAAPPEAESFGGGFAQAWADPAEAAPDADASPSLVEGAPAPAVVPPESEGFGGGFAQAWSSPAEATPDAEASPPSVEGASTSADAPPEAESFGGGFAQAWSSPAEATLDADAPPSLVESAPVPTAALPEPEGFGGGFAQAWSSPAESAPDIDAPPSSLRSEAGGAFGPDREPRAPVFSQATSESVDEAETGFHIAPPGEDAFTSPQGWDAFVSGEAPPDSADRHDPPPLTPQKSEDAPGRGGDGFQGLFAPSERGSFASSLFADAAGDSSEPSRPAGSEISGESIPKSASETLANGQGAEPNAPVGSANPVGSLATQPSLIKTASLGGTKRKRRVPSKGFIVLMAVILGLVCGAALASFVLPVGEYVVAGRAFMEGMFPPTDSPAIYHDGTEIGAVR